MCDVDALKKYDPSVYALLTNKTYAFPSVLPDGAYQGKMPQMTPVAPFKKTSKNAPGKCYYN